MSYAQIDSHVFPRYQRCLLLNIFLVLAIQIRSIRYLKRTFVLESEGIGNDTSLAFLAFLVLSASTNS